LPMRARRFAAAAAALAVITGLASCDNTPTPAARPGTTSPSATPTSTAQTSAPPAAAHPVSLPALMRKRYDGRDLRTVSVLGRNSAYTRYSVRFRSGRLRISGIMNVPAGRGPFPVLILNHGYIDPDIYTTGRGLAREQDYLARRGYVVLHVDYRNHAQSDDDPSYELNLRLGYTEDVINAVYAVKESSLPYLDGDRVGMLGRSMGGGVTFNALVVQPDLVRAAVVYAPVSSDVVDNFNRWIRRMGDRRVLAQRIAARYGSPEENPEFWRNVSPVTFFDRVSVPLIIHHGTADESVPFPWSQRSLAALQRAGKEVRLYVYEGEHHAFGPQWLTSIRRTVSFLDRYLKS
jgi:dipeptidyl aminopeptidase/acylaminoacyl peptidase